jgi:hypothetical protein
VPRCCPRRRYQWPHITYFDTPAELHAIARALLANSSRRHEISRRMRTFFRDERARLKVHVARALRASLAAAKVMQCSAAAMSGDAPCKRDSVVELTG